MRFLPKTQKKMSVQCGERVCSRHILIFWN